MKTTTSQHGERCLWRRSWSVGIATAFLAAAPFVASAQSNIATGGGNSSATYRGIHDLVGHTYEDLKAGITSECSYDEPTKVFFLYNVGTGKFLNMGGYWGTHVSLKDYPMPLWTRNGTVGDGFFHENPLNFSTIDGHLTKWVNSNSNSNTETDAGVFLNCKEDNQQYGYNGWFFEETVSWTDTDDFFGKKKKSFKIYTFATKDKPSLGTEKLYLSALSQDIATSDKNCGAKSSSDLSDLDQTFKDHDVWRIFSLQDLYDLQQKNSENLDEPIDFSFLLKCPGFERARTDIDEWNVFTSSVAAGGFTRIGLEQLNYKTVTEVSSAAAPLSRGTDENYNNGGFATSSSYTYTFPYSGTTVQNINDKKDYLRHMGKFFCMDVHGTHGYIYQKMYVKHPGTYVVKCKGYSNTPKAHLFAGVAGKDGQGKGLFDGSKRTTTLSQVSNMTEAEQSRLHVADKNMDYAGKEFYEASNYINSVIVDVTQEMIDQAGPAGACIALGIYIGNPNERNETPDANEWTVFDDFRVLYVNNVKGKDLVLDELRGDLDYLQEGVTYENSILHLAKTFTKDRWNSFVLPVDLTADQLRTAFGENVRLAKLKTLTETELQFETVNLDENTNIALEAYKPYIIFPTKTMDKYSPYTATISKTKKVMIQGEHFKIPNVTFKMTADNKNDLSYMNKDANGKYLWTSTLSDGDETIKAYGTFVRTFDPGATQNEETGIWSFSSRRGEIIPGYDNLVGSYFFDNGDVYYTENPEKVRGLRGFSCWFKPNTNNGKKPAVYLDGVKQDAELTSIGELIVGPEAANRYGKNNGVYNLQGQRVGNTTEGLPSGIYIVNGRKHVVK